MLTTIKAEKNTSPLSKVAARASAPLALVAAVLVILFLFTAGPRAQSATGRSIKLSSYPVTIEYAPDDARVAKRVAEICEDEIPRLSQQLGVTEVEPIVIEIVGDITAFGGRYANDLPRWGVAFALMGRQRMVVDVERATTAWNSLEKVIPHEFSHLLFAQRVGNVAVPIWFLEGLAKWQAYDWSLVDGWQLMNDVWSNKTPKLWHLIERYPGPEEQARAAYRLSYAAFTALFGKRTNEVPAFIDALALHRDFDTAFKTFWGEEPVVFYSRFHHELERKYHSRLLIFQPVPLFSLIAVLFLLVVLRYNLRKRRKLRALERQERGLYFDDADRS